MIKVGFGGVCFQYNREPEGKDKYWELFWPLPRLATLGVDGQYDYARAVLQHLRQLVVASLRTAREGPRRLLFSTWGCNELVWRVSYSAAVSCCLLPQRNMKGSAQPSLVRTHLRLCLGVIG